MTPHALALCWEAGRRVVESSLAISSLYLRERNVSKLYAANVRRVAAHCERLTADCINEYLRSRLESVSSVTVAYEKAVLCGLWKWAFDRELIDRPPKGVMRIKIRRRPTRAWTLDQCRLLVKGTYQYDGITLRNNVPLGKMMRAWILLAYESGARRGDLWAMNRRDFSGNTLWWCQSKTGEPVPKVLSDACVDAVNEMLAISPDGTVLGWTMLASSAARLMRQYLKKLGLTGSSKWLRRSGATHIEMVHPGKGRIHLGHATLGLAEKSYIDWTQVGREIPKTPSLIE